MICFAIALVIFALASLMVLEHYIWPDPPGHRIETREGIYNAISYLIIGIVIIFVGCMFVWPSN
jgi:hypothetical protein